MLSDVDSHTTYPLFLKSARAGALSGRVSRKIRSIPTASAKSSAFCMSWEPIPRRRCGSSTLIPYIATPGGSTSSSTPTSRAPAMAPLETASQKPSGVNLARNCSLERSEVIATPPIRTMVLSGKNSSTPSSFEGSYFLISIMVTTCLLTRGSEGENVSGSFMKFPSQQKDQPDVSQVQALARPAQNVPGESSA